MNRVLDKMHRPVGRFGLAGLLAAGAGFSVGFGLTPVGALRTAEAQVTTATMNGTILDNTGAPVEFATVALTHGPSGSTYGTLTREDGRYNVNGLRVGGPYTVSVSRVGFQTVKREGIFLQLGENLRLDLTAVAQAVEVAGVEVTADADAVLNASRTGAQTTVSEAAINGLPTISRSFTDFTRLTPQAASQTGAGSNGTSIGGRSSRLNNIQIDGAVNNDLFGLAASGTPGGQAGTTPISLDAIEQFQVLVAPYDVRQGNFTGGGINAITRSGTNAFTGSVFYFQRNQNLVGKSPDVLRTKLNDFDEKQTGFRLGGPIIPNKLFFFVNGELTRRTDPSSVVISADSATLAGYGGKLPSNVSPVSTEQARRITDALSSLYGYQTSFDSFDAGTNSNKLFARLDWNISEANRLTLRHNFVDAAFDDQRRNSTSYSLSNTGYAFNSKTNSTVAQLNTTLGSKAYNEVILGYSRIRENRGVFGTPFPQVLIKVGTNGQVLGGSERSSQANALDQDVVEVTDNFNAFLGGHTLTFGTHNEFFRFANLFIQDRFGSYEFESVDAFIAKTPSRYRFSSVNPGRNERAGFDVQQFGLYGQDEWATLPNLTLTLGMRYDVAFFPDQPSNNPAVGQVFPGRNTGKMPSGTSSYSPRFGLNFDPFSDRSTQVRGGVGLFAGRTPYVWLSNVYSNTGIEISRLDLRPAAGKPLTFSGDPNNQPGGTAVATTSINLVDPNFKLPQVLRYNLAVDQRLPFGFVGTLEGIYTKNVNDVTYRDLGLVQTGTLTRDGRPTYFSGNPAVGTKSTASASTPLPGSPATLVGRVNPQFTGVYDLTNTTQGYQSSLTAQVQRALQRNLFVTSSYTYSRAEDVNSVTNSTAQSNFEFNYISGDPNNPELTTSAYEIKHRVTLSASYKAAALFEPMIGRAARYIPEVSFIYVGQSGQPFSYVYNGDVNGDGYSGNDLLYVPKDRADTTAFALVKSSASDPRSVGQIYDEFFSYIDNDEYLSGSRGRIVTRNGGHEPWNNRLDLRLSESIPTFATQSFEVTLDVINVLNLLNSDWGRVKNVNFQNDQLLRSSGTDASGRQTFTFTNKTDPFVTSSVASRWQAQLGVRYSF